MGVAGIWLLGWLLMGSGSLGRSGSAPWDPVMSCDVLLNLLNLLNLLTEEWEIHGNRLCQLIPHFPSGANI